MYAYLFFLTEPNYCAPIINVNSGWEAWKKLVAEYKKDSAMMCMALHQQFYSLMHDPVVGIIIFIDAVLSIIQQLGEIGHKLDYLKISDKFLIGLHKSWAPIHTALLLCEKSEKPKIEKITSARKQFEAQVTHGCTWTAS